MSECRVVPITTKKDGSPIDHDSDPVIIEIHYPVKVSSDAYVRPIVKIEISCLSMKEPYEVKRISSLVGEAFPQIDDETIADIPTIMPTRTFLEKAFLLNEEYQRKNPRTERMSRHLYDLERLMDTQFAEAALSDMDLYHEIIAHTVSDSIMLVVSIMNSTTRQRLHFAPQEICEKRCDLTTKQ